MNFYPTHTAEHPDFEKGVDVKGEVRMGNQEVLIVKYLDPNGKIQELEISTSHLVMLVEHKNTNACMLIRPSVGAQFLEGTK